MRTVRAVTSFAEPTPPGITLAATPIGHPGDASARLRRALAEADIIAAEDTRRLRALASALHVEPRGEIISFFEHNELARIPDLLECAHGGARIVVVTDAGMPSVSDPGFSLVTAAIADDVPVTCLPGPSAVTTALVLSGLPVDRFAFDGFAPRKSGKRRAWLRDLAAEQRTTVFFESPHRLADTLSDAVAELGPQRRAAVCRELTKTYEEVLRGTLGELAEHVRAGVRGEVVVVIAPAAAEDIAAAAVGAPAAGAADSQVVHDAAVARVLDRVAAGERLKAAATEIAAATGLSRKTLYDAAISARDAAAKHSQ